MSSLIFCILKMANNFNFQIFDEFPKYLRFWKDNQIKSVSRLVSSLLIKFIFINSVNFMNIRCPANFKNSDQLRKFHFQFFHVDDTSHFCGHVIKNNLTWILKESVCIQNFSELIFNIMIHRQWSYKKSRRYQLMVFEKRPQIYLILVPKKIFKF